MATVSPLPAQPVAPATECLSFTALATEAALGTTSVTSHHHRPPNLPHPTINTPISATSPSFHNHNRNHSPLKVSFLRRDDTRSSKSPLTPPLAYLDYLKSFSSNINGTGTGTNNLPSPKPYIDTPRSVSISFPEGLNPPPTPRGCTSLPRPVLPSYPSTSSVESGVSEISTATTMSDDTVMEGTSDETAVSAVDIKKEQSENPVAAIPSPLVQQNAASSMILPPPQRPPTSSDTNVRLKQPPLRRPSLMILVASHAKIGSPTLVVTTPGSGSGNSSTTTSASTASSSSASASTVLRTPLTATTPMMTRFAYHPLSPSCTSSSGMNVRQVVTRIVTTYTHVQSPSVGYNIFSPGVGHSPSYSPGFAHGHTRTTMQQTQTQTQTHRVVVSGLSPRVIGDGRGGVGTASSVPLAPVCAHNIMKSEGGKAPLVGDVPRGKKRRAE